MAGGDDAGVGDDEGVGCAEGAEAVRQLGETTWAEADGGAGAGVEGEHGGEDELERKRESGKVTA